jgi:hypothetical protein
MTKKCVEKLMDVGYVFIRTRDIPNKDGKVNYAIMQSKTFGIWTKLESFATKAARTRRMEILEKLSNTIIN